MFALAYGLLVMGLAFALWDAKRGAYNMVKFSGRCEAAHTKENFIPIALQLIPDHLAAATSIAF